MITLALVVILLVAVYFYNVRTFNYWQKRGVKYDKPIIFFGNNARNFLMIKSVTEIAAEMYRKYPNERVVGFFRSTQPELVIRDPEIAKRILITDFSCFYGRGLNPHKTVIEPLMRNLFFADGDLWRLLRQRMSPAFTSGKLRAMFPLILERTERLQRRAAVAAASGKPIDARDLMARYTTDFIGACGFGLDSDCLSDDNSAFRKLSAKIFNINALDFFVAILKESFPELCKNLHFLYRYEKDIIDLVNDIQKQRNYKPSGRNDFIDLLLECQQKGTIVGESIERMKPDGTPEQCSLVLDAELIAAQVFVFFAAGFETSSSASSFTLLQLAFNPDKQNKVKEEIDRVLEKYDGKLCYEAVRELTYLECAFREAMRMFPSLGFLVRETSRRYTFPELGLTIDEGIPVSIPLQALHNDPRYFDAPQEFRPERFLHSSDLTKYVYMPFGAGPRACIGERLGIMQSLAGLAAVLSRFTLSPAPLTPRDPPVDPKSAIVQTLKCELPLIFTQRDNADNIYT